MIHTEYYKDGTPCECDEMRRLTYFGAKELFRETPYINGRRNGLRREYYPSGGFRCKTPYADGKIHGREKMYYPSGALEQETPYVNGQEHGIQKVYYENGLLRYEELWTNGNFRNHHPVENFL